MLLRTVHMFVVQRHRHSCVIRNVLMYENMPVSCLHVICLQFKQVIIADTHTSHHITFHCYYYDAFLISMLCSLASMTGKLFISTAEKKIIGVKKGNLSVFNK